MKINSIRYAAILSLVTSTALDLQNCQAFTFSSSHRQGHVQSLSTSALRRKNEASHSCTVRHLQQRQPRHSISTLFMSFGPDEQDQAKEALQSLGDFHTGSWTGRATSFTVTADVAAGIVQKKTSPDYRMDVSFTYTPAGSLALQEICSWQKGEELTFASSRQMPLVESSVDCDDVDASYSLHVHASTTADDNDDQKETLDSKAGTVFPAELIGTDKAVHFAVEHCLACSDDARVRMLALYGEKQELIRVVVCDEVRLFNIDKDTTTPKPQSLTAADLLELQSDVDRLVDKIAGKMKPGRSSSSTSSSSSSIVDATIENDDERSTEVDYTSVERLQKLKDVAGTPLPLSPASKEDQEKADNQGIALKRHPMSLLELTSGIWQGDAIIRDNPTIAGCGTGKQTSSGGKSIQGGKSGKGFGAPSSNDTDDDRKSSRPPAFGSWEVGVQKVAREWLWDFGEQIRQHNNAGKALGADMEPGMGQSMAGSVIENQSLKRRIPKEERMVYIDWNDGNGDNHVGFILGSVSIQVPRFSTFGSRQSKPFYTELCIYQSADDKDGATSETLPVEDGLSVVDLPEVVCSRICRIYNSQGQFKQGCTSLYTLKRFDAESEVAS